MIYIKIEKIGIIELLEYLDDELIIKLIKESSELSETLNNLEEEHKISIHNGVPYVNLTNDFEPKLLYNGTEVRLVRSNDQLMLQYHENHIFSYDYAPVNNLEGLEHKLYELYGDKTKANLYAVKLLNEYLF